VRRWTATAAAGRATYAPPPSREPGGRVAVVVADDLRKFHALRSEFPDAQLPPHAKRWVGSAWSRRGGGGR